jgi:calpain
VNWARVSDEEKERIGFVNKDNGEFWIALDDFRKEFSAITVCTAGPDSNCDGEADDVNTPRDFTIECPCDEAFEPLLLFISGYLEKIQVKMVYGEWSANLGNAGGCQNDLSSYATNPQYSLTVTEPDDDDEDCSVVIGLMQIFRREARHLGLRMLEIGFAVFEVLVLSSFLNSVS